MREEGPICCHEVLHVDALGLIAREGGEETDASRLFERFKLCTADKVTLAVAAAVDYHALLSTEGGVQLGQQGQVGSDAGACCDQQQRACLAGVVAVTAAEGNAHSLARLQRAEVEASAAIILAKHRLAAARAAVGKVEQARKQISLQLLANDERLLRAGRRPASPAHTEQSWLVSPRSPSPADADPFEVRLRRREQGSAERRGGNPFDRSASP